MGEQNVSEDADRQQLRRFTRALLDDVRALDRMIAAGQIETGVRRIGAEQEMFLVDSTGGPASKAVEVLGALEKQDRQEAVQITRDYYQRIDAKMLAMLEGLLLAFEGSTS